MLREDGGGYTFFWQGKHADEEDYMEWACQQNQSDEGHPFPTSWNQQAPHEVALHLEQDSSCNHHQCLCPCSHQHQ